VVEAASRRAAAEDRRSRCARGRRVVTRVMTARDEHCLLPRGRIFAVADAFVDRVLAAGSGRRDSMSEVVRWLRLFFHR